MRRQKEGLTGVAVKELEWHVPPEFDALAQEEPELWRLFGEVTAVAVEQDGLDTPFCANHLWYRDFKPEVTRLVGWLRKGHPVLGTSQAYNTAYQTLWEILPDCRHEGLCRWEPPRPRAEASETR
jgi:hypothetical protein